jgi:CRP-like cAMP-binding protein
MGQGDLVPRIITNFDVRIHCEADRTFRQTWPVNLSETGACLRLSTKVTPGQPVQLQIRLAEDAEAMEVNGRIVWVRHDPVNEVYYCGMGFTDLSGDQLMMIRQYAKLGSEALLLFLSEFPLFEEFSREDCRSLLRIVTLRELDKKEILYVAGTRDMDLQGLFIVQSGLLNIYEGSQPRLERHLAVVSPGQIFGESTLLTDQPHSATIMAVNHSRLIQINKVGFQLLSEKEPQLALKLMKVVARALVARLGRTTKKLFSPTRFDLPSTRRG